MALIWNDEVTTCGIHSWDLSWSVSTLRLPKSLVIQNMTAIINLHGLAHMILGFVVLILNPTYPPQY